MQSRIISYLIITLILFFQCLESSAQLLKRRKAKPYEIRPDFILVQINTGQRKIERLKKKNETKYLVELLNDIGSVNKNMVADFNKNFDFCPVYFFYDTCTRYIITQDFEGRVMDTSLNVVHNFHPADTNYFVVQLGRINNSEEYSQNTLVASDWRGQQLRHPLPYTYDHTLTNSTVLQNNEYYYMSKRFDLNYRPEAEAYSLTLKRFYRMQPRKKAKKTE